MKITKATAGLVTATAAVALLTGCGSTKDDDCRTTPVVMFFGTDGHYHYGSPTGKVVPAASVPKTAQKVPGYKAPAAPKVDLKKPDPAKVDTKPAAPKAPAPAAPRPAPKVGR